MKKWFSLGIVLFFGIILFNWIFKYSEPYQTNDIAASGSILNWMSEVFTVYK